MANASIPDLRRLAFEQGVLSNQRTREELLSAVKITEPQMSDRKAAEDTDTIVIPLYVPGEMTTPTISPLPATCPTGTVVQANIIPIPLNTQVQTIGSRAADVPPMGSILDASQRSSTEDFNRGIGVRTISAAPDVKTGYPSAFGSAPDVKTGYPSAFGSAVQPSIGRIDFKRATPRTERKDISVLAGVPTTELENLLQYSGVKRRGESNVGNTLDVSTLTLDWLSQQTETWFLTAISHLGLNPRRNMADSIGILFYLNFFNAPIVLNVEERRRITSMADADLETYLRNAGYTNSSLAYAALVFAALTHQTVPPPEPGTLSPARSKEVLDWGHLRVVRVALYLNDLYDEKSGNPTYMGPYRLDIVRPDKPIASVIHSYTDDRLPVFLNQLRILVPDIFDLEARRNYLFNNLIDYDYLLAPKESKPPLPDRAAFKAMRLDDENSLIGLFGWADRTIAEKYLTPGQINSLLRGEHGLWGDRQNLFMTIQALAQ